MAPLADELAADLLSSDDENGQQLEDQKNNFDGNGARSVSDSAIENGNVPNDNIQGLKDDVSPEAWRAQHIDSIAKRVRSPAWTRIMQDIEKHLKKETLERDAAAQEGDQFDAMRSGDDEYNTIVSANMIAQEMDDEMRIVVKYIRDRYAKRFPELEGLVLNPIDYARTVKEIGNEMDLANIKLHLPSATAMVVAVAASDSRGVPLTQQELDCVLEGCNTVFFLDKIRKTVFDYVRSRINLIAPNLSAVVGTTTAANLIGFAGGLTGLSKIPACNLAALGAKKQSGIGLSSGIGVRNQGYIYQSELIRKVVPDFRTQVQRIAAAKIALAARVDSVRESQDGTMGRKLRQDIEEKIEMLQEPPAKNGIKALPRPDDKPKKRRGGKRIQKAKGQYAMTELRKQQNRMAFGVQEEEVGFGDETEGLGMLGKSTGGPIRSATIDQRTKLRLSKNRKLQLERMLGQPQQQLLGSNTVPSGIQTSGMMSSLNLSSVQGLELVNPIANRKLASVNQDKWFSSGLYSQIKRD